MVRIYHDKEGTGDAVGQRGGGAGSSGVGAPGEGSPQVKSPRGCPRASGQTRWEGLTSAVHTLATEPTCRSVRSKARRLPLSKLFLTVIHKRGVVSTPSLRGVCGIQLCERRVFPDLTPPRTPARPQPREWEATAPRGDTALTSPHLGTARVWRGGSPAPRPGSGISRPGGRQRGVWPRHRRNAGTQEHLSWSDSQEGLRWPDLTEG